MILYIGIHWEIINSDNEGHKRLESLGWDAYLPGAFGNSNEKPTIRRQPRTQGEYRGRERKWFKWEETVRVQITA